MIGVAGTPSPLPMGRPQRNLQVVPVVAAAGSAAAGSATGKSLSSTAAAAPVWEDDSAVDECRLCRKQFSLFVRRHHCRRYPRHPGSCRLKDPRFWLYREIPVGAEMCPGSGRCGMIFCKECTEAKRVLPHIHANQLQRVCDACVVQLNTL